MYHLWVLQAKKGQCSIEKEKQFKRDDDICNSAKHRNVCEDNKPTDPKEGDEPSSSGGEHGETASPSNPTKNQPNSTCQHIKDAHLPHIILQLGTTGHDENMDNEKEEWNKPAESDETDSNSSFFGQAV